MKIYKVRCNITGLYWKGGGLNSNGIPNWLFKQSNDKNGEMIKACFSKKGKTWNQINFVRSAFTSTDKFLKDYLLENCTIIEYEIIEKSHLNFIK